MGSIVGVVLTGWRAEAEGVGGLHFVGSIGPRQERGWGEYGGDGVLA